MKDGVLALDINSKSVGVAFGGDDSGAPRFATWVLPGAEDGELMTRGLGRLYSSIYELAGLIRPRIVAIEAPFMKLGGGSNAKTAIAMFSFAAVARAAGANCGAQQVKLVAVSTWRKHFCGSGYPENPKEATLRMCRLFGWTPKNDDEGDAAGLWAYEMALSFPKWGPKTTPLLGRPAQTTAFDAAE